MKCYVHFYKRKSTLNSYLLRRVDFYRINLLLSNSAVWSFAWAQNCKRFDQFVWNGQLEGRVVGSGNQIQCKQQYFQSVNIYCQQTHTAVVVPQSGRPLFDFAITKMDRQPDIHVAVAAATSTPSLSYFDFAKIPATCLYICDRYWEDPIEFLFLW